MRILKSRFASLPPFVCAVAVIFGSGASADTMTAGDFLPVEAAQTRLGQLLFYDKILSGNLNISCATCHHHSLNGTDGVSLGLGEGGYGLGPDRLSGLVGTTRVQERVPRNAPALWNVGHKTRSVMFHDGRVEADPAQPSGFRTPARDQTPLGLNSIVAAQALFPPTSATEMRGSANDNEVAQAFTRSFTEGWEALAARVRAKPAYETAFRIAFPHVRRAEDITIVEIVNAIAAFEMSEWQSFDSPYDDYVTAGVPLDPLAERGRQLFFGDAGCASCHSGPLFTDQNYYAAGVPQFGPGRRFPGNDLPVDMGRMETTRNPADAYKFRVPSLRNVALTGPWGHNGAYSNLRDMIRHMCDPVTTRANWTPGMARLPDVPWLSKDDFTVVSLADEQARQAAVLDITPVEMVEADIDALEAFLNSLTGKTALTRPLGRPDHVPSGLPVD
ncbi:cytochrome-c peroxidase [Sagittula salina]|uniref:Methylamine utilization protein MauG n=1 Tax=Sagittula salina TaxID=2820268 RepID=A0A940S0R4_9RHOB|nr:cytochrome c peroxidase [Sagittula salina]MBP0482297.1 methylamine utilization protein MauG [Sagittula salina]